MILGIVIVMETLECLMTHQCQSSAQGLIFCKDSQFFPIAFSVVFGMAYGEFPGEGANITLRL